MTALTLQPEIAAMYLWFFVAIHTHRRGTAENLVKMAIFARYFDMLSIQDEKTVMVEVAHSIDPVMASKTILTKLEAVLFHENRVLLGMARHTDIDVKRHCKTILGSVTTRTAEGVIRKIDEVAGQREAGILKMVETTPAQANLRRPACRGMANGTICREKPEVQVWFNMAVHALKGNL